MNVQRKTAGKYRRHFVSLETLEHRLALSGLSIAESQYWHQDQLDILDTSESLDQFAVTLAAGDFNNDDIADLAVGIPGESIVGNDAAGAVQVIYGSRNQLTATNNQFWHQDVDGVVGDSETGDLFGAVLAVGDFNGDGRDDLAIGIPDEEINGNAEAGAVAVLYGGSEGLSAEGDQFWHQDVENLRGDSEAGDHFGEALVAGDFNDDGFADLAVGIPGEGVNGQNGAGAVAIIFGSAAGLTTAGDQLWNQDDNNLRDSAEAGDAFGAALASGDFNRDGFSDLAIGVPSEDIDAKENAGAVSVMYGSRDGLTTAGDDFLYQDLTEILGEAEQNDQFGFALAAADFNRDGADDLATGIPGKTIRGLSNAGAVHVILGSSVGITGVGDQLWTQDDLGINETSEPGDLFGEALATGDFNNDEAAELVIGAPGETIDLRLNAGVLTILNGSREGLVATDSATWNQADLGEVINDDEFFASSFAVGKFDDDTFFDLAIGAPLDLLSNVRAGAANVVYGSADSDQPTVTINQAPNQADPVIESPIRFSVEFSEPVTGFDGSDLLLTGTAGATTAVVTGTGTSYEVAVSGMTNGGTVVASIPAGSAFDGFGNPNTVSTSFDNSVTFEESVTVLIIQSADQEDPTADAVIEFVAQFSEPVFGFEASDVLISGTADPTSVSISGGGTDYSIRVSGMSQTGTVTANIPSGVAINAAGSPNSASTTIDNTVQFQQGITVVVGQGRNQPDPTTDTRIAFAVQFSEPVTGFRNEDVILSGSAGATLALVTGEGANYDVVVQGMTSSGTVTLEVPAGVVTDAAGNPNSASTGLDTTVTFTLENDPLPVGWTNTNALDVNNDGVVTALDALRIINEINAPTVSDSTGALPPLSTIPADPPGYVDANQDGFVSPRDALMLIIFLNEQNAAASDVATALDDDS